jgi:NitT/TauT family transport system permease protein
MSSVLTAPRAAAIPARTTPKRVETTPATPRQRSWAAVAARQASTWATRSAVILAFLALWETAPRLGLVDRVFLVPFSEVLTALHGLVASGELWQHTSASLSRALLGFGAAIAIAVPLGIAIGWYRPVSNLLTPILELFRNTAALALLPVFVLLLGIGETSKVALVIYACTFPILLNTISGVRTVDPLLIRSATSLGLSPLRLFQKVVLPAAVPTIFTGIRLAGASSILVLIAAEMVGARAGLGYLITASQLNFQIPNMYAGIVTIALVGVVLNGLLVGLERRFSRWRTQN